MNGKKLSRSIRFPFDYLHIVVFVVLLCAFRDKWKMSCRINNERTNDVELKTFLEFMEIETCPDCSVPYNLPLECGKEHRTLSSHKNSDEKCTNYVHTVCTLTKFFS